MSVIQSIKIYGERGSGTKYLESLVSENLVSVEVRKNDGWKHFFPIRGVEGDINCLFFIISRNPFDWVQSLHRNPWHAAPELRGLSLSDFIRKPWWCVLDEQTGTSPNDPQYGTEMMFERCPETGHRFSNVLQLRSAKLRSWDRLRSSAAHAVHITFEDLKAQPEVFIETVSNRFQLTRKATFRDVPHKSAIYDAMLEDDLKYIISQLDLPLEERMGHYMRVASDNAIAGHVLASGELVGTFKR